MRRQTLGVVHSKATQDRGRVRHSMAASRPGYQGMGAANRRSSVYGKGTLIQDPRPIKSKEFREKSTERLIEYLVSKGFEGHLSPQAMKCPSTKLFQDMVKFLIHQIDPTFGASSRFDEAVSFFFSKIGYPIKLSKGSIKSASTPHVWPSILAALVWLVELLMYNERISQQSSSDFSPAGENENGDEKSPQDILEQLSIYYSEWLSGHMDDAMVDEQLVAFCTSNCEYMEQEKETFHQANNKLLNEIEEEKKFATLESLQDVKNVRERDLRKFKEFLNSLQPRMAQKKRNLDMASEEFAKKSKEVDNLRARVEELAEILRHQTISPDDVKAMRARQNQLEESIDEWHVQKEQVRNQIKVDEHAIRNRVASIEQRSARMNEWMERLRVLPRQELHERCPLNQIVINSNLLNPSKSDLENRFRRSTWFCDQDLSAMNSKLDRYRDSRQRELDEQDLNLREARKEKDQKKREIKEMEQTIAFLKERSQQVNDENQRVRQRWLEVQNSTTARVEKMELAMTSSQSQGTEEAEAHRLRKELDKRRKQVVQLSNQCESRKRQVQEHLCRVMQMAAKYRIFVRGKLKEVCEQVDGLSEQAAFAMLDIRIDDQLPQGQQM